MRAQSECVFGRDIESSRASDCECLAGAENYPELFGPFQHALRKTGADCSGSQYFVIKVYPAPDSLTKLKKTLTSDVLLSFYSSAHSALC